MQDEERRFGSDLRAYLGDDGFHGLRRAAELIGLELCGFDITRLESGEVLIFEANPAMDYDIKHGRGFPYLERNFMRLAEAVDRMVADMGRDRSIRRAPR
jgi:hypothetical protein